MIGESIISYGQHTILNGHGLTKTTNGKPLACFDSIEDALKDFGMVVQSPKKTAFECHYLFIHIVCFLSNSRGQVCVGC